MSRTADEFLARHSELLTEDRTSLPMVRAVAALTAPLSAYFRFRIRGLERVPDGACLAVANHSIAAPAEVLLLLRAWRKQFGDRPARGLVHQIAWQSPFQLAPLLQKIGGLFAHPHVARAALRKGHAVLVFPGGDIEACRSFRDRYRIVFDGRAGFIRLARETNVPIVPIVVCGSHAAFVVLPGTRPLARFTGVTRPWGFKAFPLTLGAAATAMLIPTAIALPILWPMAAISLAQMFVPLPTRIDARVLDPIRVSSEESDDAAAERVRRSMQLAMNDMAAERLTPWG